MNALEIYCEGIGSTVYYGPGAGPRPTASAVIADLVDLSNGGWPVSSKNNINNVLSKECNHKFSRYFKLDVKNEAGAIAKVSSLFAEKNVSIEALIQNEIKNNSIDDTHVPVVIISGELSDKEAISLKITLEEMTEISGLVQQLRIHNAL